MGATRRWFVLIGVLALGACGGDDSSSTAAESAVDETTLVETTEAADPTADITAVYERFFDGTDTDMAAKLALLQSPDALEDVFTRAFGDPPSPASSRRCRPRS